MGKSGENYKKPFMLLDIDDKEALESNARGENGKLLRA
jgi:hypothetical protein